MCDNEIGLCVYNMDIILGSVVNVTGVVLQDPFSSRNNFHFDLLQLLHFNSDSITEKEVPHATHNCWRDDIEFPVRSNGNFSVELEVLTTRPHTLHGKSFTLFGAKLGPLRVRNPHTHTQLANMQVPWCWLAPMLLSFKGLFAYGYDVRGLFQRVQFKGRGTGANAVLTPGRPLSSSPLRHKVLFPLHLFARRCHKLKLGVEYSDDGISWTMTNSTYIV